MKKTFRHSEGFGKRIEYWFSVRCLRKAIDVYVPLVDGDAIDAVIKKKEVIF